MPDFQNYFQHGAAAGLAVLLYVVVTKVVVPLLPGTPKNGSNGHRIVSESNRREMDSIDKRVEKLEAQQAKLSRLETTQEHYNQRIAANEGRISRVEREYHEIYGLVTGMQREVDKAITMLEFIRNGKK